MARIYVQFAGLQRLEEGCKTMPKQIDGIKDDFQRIISQLDWDVKYKADINATARRIAQNLEQQQQAMKAYSTFLQEAYQEYAKLDEYQKQKENPFTLLIDPRIFEVLGPGGQFHIDYDWIDFFSSFGNFGQLFKLISGLVSLKDLTSIPKTANKIFNLLSKMAQDYGKYKKIGRAIGAGKANAYFLRKEAGLYQPGYASRASNPVARFKNNLTNKTSAFNIKDAFSSFTGKNGAGAATAAWGGVLLSAVGNLFGNLEEQKNSNGSMSTARVIEETVSETAISTVGSIVGGVLIGAAITAITGGVAAPAVVAIVGGVTMAGINAGSEAVFGESVTEWASDLVVDTFETGAKAIGEGAKAVCDWFGKLWS